MSVRRIVAIIVTIFAGPSLAAILFVETILAWSLVRNPRQPSSWIVLVILGVVGLTTAATVLAVWKAAATADKNETLARAAAQNLTIGRIDETGGADTLHSVLQLESLPAAIGGVCRGRIDVDADPQAFAAVPSLGVTLSMLLRNEDSDGYITDIPMWQQTKQVPGSAIVPRAGGVSIPVDFRIPPNAEESNALKANGEIRWRMDARATTFGKPLAATFEVPVSRTAASPVVHKPALAAVLGLPIIEPVPQRDTPAPPPRVQTVGYRETARGLEISFPAGQQRSTGLFMLGVGALFGLPIFFMWQDHWIVTLFVLVPTVAFCGWAGIDAIFFSSVVVVGRGSVDISRRGLVFVSRDIVPASAIADVQLLMGGSSGTSSRKSVSVPRTYYTLYLLKADGKRTAIGKYLERSEGEWLADQIRRRLGSGPHSPLLIATSE